MAKITPRERTAILSSLASGVVPSIGLEHIQVGRKDEVEAVLGDLKAVEDGGAAVRFVVGPYGSGKTFFLHLMRTVALRRRFVVVQADLTLNRRLHSTSGDARALFSELMRNLATGSRPQGGALSNVIESWIGELDFSVREKGGIDGDVKRSFVQQLKPLQELVSGYDFVNVLTKYYEGYLSQNEQLQASALRWLRAGYTTKTEARTDLGVRTIIDDASFYPYLQLFAAFVRIAGFIGLLVNIDELTVLSHHLTSGPARKNNYEEILRILNDCLQGITQGLTFLFAGTDECLEDTRRGLYSYEPLASRLAPNRFATDGRRDLSSPVIRLDRLTTEDCALLLNNIRTVFALGESKKNIIPDQAITAYLQNCQARLGADCFQTPRDIVKDFVGLLRVIEQNPAENWQKLVESPETKPEGRQDSTVTGGLRKTGLSEFRL